jgi:AcrR family transcriptional regulator
MRGDTRMDDPEGQAIRAGRPRSNDRKSQIVRATVRLIGQRGLTGVFLSHIADAVGVSDAALYRHFESKDDILMGAFDLLIERTFDWMGSFDEPSVLTRLKRMAETHASVFSKDIEGFNAPMFQFIVWMTHDRVRKHVDSGHRAVMDAHVALLEEGKAQGTVRLDIDSELIAAEWYGCWWWEDLSYLRGMDEGAIERGAEDMYGRIIGQISPPVSSEGASPA